MKRVGTALLAGLSAWAGVEIGYAMLARAFFEGFVFIFVLAVLLLTLYLVSPS